jgi:ELWxxDGT repeat protein
MRLGAVVAAVVLCCPLVGGAQPARLLDDVRLTPRPRGHVPRAIVALGDSILLSGLSVEAGHELFRSDGTPEGTVLVRDIARGSAASSAPAGFVRLGPLVYFTADDGVLGRELWRTDGTEAGTRLVADIAPGPTASSPAGLVARGRELFFSADDGIHGIELWSTDGTPEGTRLVRDIWPGSAPSSPRFLSVGPGGDLYFGARGSGYGLWRSDGTAGGTHQIVASSLGAGGVWAIVYAGGRLFAAIDGKVWASDGTAGGSAPVPGDYATGPVSFAVVGRFVYFPASSATGSTEMWRTDGTAAGTSCVKPGLLVFTSLDPSEPVFLVNGPYVYFWGYQGTGFYPWRTDGTEAGTVRLTASDAAGSQPYFSIGNLGAFDGSVFFVLKNATGRALFRTDGNAGDAALVRDLPAPPFDFQDDPDVLFTHTASLLFFGAYDPTMAGEPMPWTSALWTSDGTGAGTAPISAPTVSSAPLFPLPVGGRVAFRADADGVGREWRASADASVGSELLTESCVGACSEYVSDLWPPAYPPLGAPLGDRLHFPHRTAALGGEPWGTDGTANGTALVADVNPGADFGLYANPVASNGIMFFAGSGSGSDVELWASDGTAAGTRLVRDIAPGPQGSHPSRLADVAGRLFFAADNAGELWTSDGTAAGTVLVADPTGGQIDGITAFDDRALIVLRRGSSIRELWVSDGTTAGTGPVLTTASVSGPLVVAGGRAFFAAQDEAHGRELWSSDGRTASLVRDIAEGPIGASPRELVALGGDVYFSAFDAEHGVELWRSDGTAGGTALVSNLAPGPTSSAPQSLLAADGRLWFSAETAAHGRELWMSIGTAEGTRLVQDIAPGPASSSPYATAHADGWLFFAADDGTHGVEPWALTIVPTIVTDDAAVVEQPGGAVAVPRVRLVGTPASAVTLAYATASGTATSGDDFAPTAGTLTFVPGGPAEQTIAVPVMDDAIDEDEQDFTVVLSGAVLGGGVARISIADDDGPPLLTASPATVVEGHAGPTVARFALGLHPHSERTASVAYATADGTATAPADYVAASGSITFPPGVSALDVDVLVTGDRRPEPNETFTLQLSAPQDLVLASSQAGGLILDDDGVVPPGQELAHGTRVTRVFVAPARFRLAQRPHASYEVVLDAASGDALPATLDRLAPDGSTVLQSAAAGGTGAGLSLRWENPTGSGVDQETIAVAAACAPCTVAETYRLRVYETTLSGPRFNDVGTQRTAVVLFNGGAATTAGRVYFWSEAGALLHERAFDLAPFATFVFDTTQEPSLVGRAGSITVAHDGPFGDLVGKAVSLDAATGFAFDHPFASRPR